MFISPCSFLSCSDGGKRCIYYQFANLYRQENISISLVIGDCTDIDDAVEIKKQYPKLKKIFIFQPVRSKIKKSNTIKKMKEIVLWLFSGKPRQAQTLSSNCNRTLIMDYIKQNSIKNIVLQGPYSAEYIDFNSLEKLNCLTTLIEHNVEYLFRKDCLEKYGIFSALEVYLTRKYEKNILDNVNKVVAISPKDKEILKVNMDVDDICYLPVVFEKRGIRWTGRDSNYIVFNGSLSFYPNYHGMKCFLDNVYDEFKKKYPQTVLKITGKVSEKIKREFEVYQQVMFTGFLSDEELDKCLANCIFVVIPIWKGSGIKIKLLEALSKGIPAVCTQHCLEGIPFKDNVESYKVAENHKEFVSIMIELMNNKNIREAISQKELDLFDQIYASARNKSNWANKFIGR